MDKKKLIGTILGVTLFAALIVGATFAWFTGTTNIGSTAEANTKNFIINYSRGSQDISKMPKMKNASCTPAQADSTTITLKKADTNTVDGTGTITLTTTSNSFPSSTIHYDICEGTCSTLSTEKVINGTGDKILVSDIPITSGEKTYTVYFWSDYSKVSASGSYKGYIHASATMN